MLTIEGLEVHYGKVTAVRDLNMVVNAGEIVGLIGPNGAGKTTTLSVVSGLKRAASGTVQYDGKLIGGLRPEQIVEIGLALVPEGRHIFRTLTVMENLVIGGTPRAKDGHLGRDIDSCMDRFPVLRQFAKSPAWKLSGGQQQQLAIARSLLSKPRLLMMDEPSLGLDPKTIDTVFELIAELRDEGVTVLLVEQNARRTVQLADRCYVMSTGSLVLDGDRADLLATADFSAMYLGRKVRTDSSASDDPPSRM